MLVELDQVPEVVLKIRKRLIRSFEIRKRDGLVVPFLACDFASLTPDTRCRIDQLCNAVGSTRGPRSFAGRRGNQLEELLDHIFSRFTRNPLYSGVPEL